MIAGLVLKDIAGGRRKSDTPEEASSFAGVKAAPVFKDQVGSLVDGRGKAAVESELAVKVVFVGIGEPVAVDDPPVLSSPVGEPRPDRASEVGAWAEPAAVHRMSRP